MIFWNVIAEQKLESFVVVAAIYSKCENRRFSLESLNVVLVRLGWDPKRRLGALLLRPRAVELTCEDDSALTPLWKAAWGTRWPPAWTGCSLAISALARLMMSPMRWMKPSFSDGRMNSLWTWTTEAAERDDKYLPRVSGRGSVTVSCRRHNSAPSLPGAAGAARKTP